MAKRTITTWWMWGLVAMIPGAILIPSSALALLAHLQFVRPGVYNFVPDDYSWTMVTLMVLGCIVCCSGCIAQFVAWIGAVVNTNQIADKTWFNALLWGGMVAIVTMPLFGLGGLISWSLMIAYLVGGPDGVVPKPPQVATPAESPKTLVPMG